MPAKQVELNASERDKAIARFCESDCRLRTAHSYRLAEFAVGRGAIRKCSPPNPPAALYWPASRRHRRWPGDGLLMAGDGALLVV